MANIKKYRIGNDIPVTWRVLTNGERASLEGRQLTVTCTDVLGHTVPVEWTTRGCEVSATIRGKDQRNTGVLVLELVENAGADNQHVVDVMAVELVAHSWQLDHNPAGDAVLLTANIETSLSVAEITAFRTIAASIPAAMEAATEANEAAAAQLLKGVQRYNNDWWNTNCLLEPGFYEGCWRGRPAGSTDDEFYTCIVTISKRADQNEGVDVVSQVAISSRDAQRVFTRKILTTDRTVYEPPTTVYEDWKQLGADALAVLESTLRSAITSAVANETQRAQGVEAVKLDASKIGTSGSGLKKDNNGNVLADTFGGNAGSIIESQTGSEWDAQLINVFMVRWLLQYYAKAAEVYTKAQVDSKIVDSTAGLSEHGKAISGYCLDQEFARKATTLAGYNISDAYTKTEVGALLSAIGGRIDSLDAALDALVGEDDATSVIDTFNEVVAFLNGINGTTLDTLLTTIRNSVAAETQRAQGVEATKQDIIEDLQTIRSGAALGATSIQQHQDISGKADKSDTYTKTEVDAAIGGVNDDIDALDARISDLEFAQADYYVEGYTKGTTDATPVKSYGAKDLLKRFDFYLLDTTRNTGTTTHPVGKLQANNLLRFADGGAWAPVVGITAAQAADALLELYVKQGGEYVQYCAAGEYDAEAYVTDVLRPYYAGTLTYDGPELYKSDGEGGYVEAHALCPWETTETKYTIGLAADRKIYVLDNVVGESGYVWKGIFIGRTEWDGIDLTPYALEKTAIAPCPVCTINDNGTHKTRSFFYLYQGDTNCQSYVGLNGLHMFDVGNRTYPRSVDITQVANMSMARANNSDTESPLPFAEGGYFALDAFIIAQELLYSRRNPFRGSQFGSGISSNDTCNSETSWRTNGGVRFRKSDAAAPSYAAFSTNTPFYYNASEQRSDWSNTLNQYAPKEQCMESQIVASFITEFGLAATTDATAPNYFNVYGGKYYYMAVADAEGLDEGYMNVRVYREIEAHDTPWYDAEGNAVTYDIAVVLRMSLMGGANLSGDFFAYWGGGAEVVGTCGENTANGTFGHLLDFYLQPDQSKWQHETTYTKNAGGRFDFEADDAYLHLGQAVTTANSYAIQRHAYVPMFSMGGGNIAQGECYYSYMGKYWSSTQGQRARVGLRFRGNAYNGICSPRYWYAPYAASTANRTYGGTAQARID